MGLRDRWLGEPSARAGGALLLAIRLGSPPARIRAVRELARRGSADLLVGHLDDAVPGVRRAAARGLAWAGQRKHLERLLVRLDVEPTDTVRNAVAAACLACGGEERVVRATLRSRSRLRIATFAGPRRCGPPYDLGAALLDEIGDASGPASGIGIDASWRDLEDPEGFARARRAASHDPQGLLDHLATLAATAGRRESHGIVELYGIIGDPTAIPRLAAAFDDGTVDPARGFAQRRAAALALGRIGDPRAGRSLVAALGREVRDREGRPGAGLGVQFPVRHVLLWALGEVGDVNAARVLADHLGAVASSALGGLHLPAMAALVKLGTPVLPLVARVLDGPETAAVHAAAVIGAAGDSRWRDRALADPRPEVRAAAAAGSHPPEDPVGEALAAFADARFYEAHEILEAEWRDETGERRTALHALIHGAVALEHLAHGNVRGAVGQWQKACAKLDRLPPVAEGVDLAEWRARMDAFFGEHQVGDGALGALPPTSSWPRPIRERRRP